MNAEKEFLYECRFLEYRPQNHINSGKFAGQGVEFAVVFFPCVFLGKGIPEPLKLVQTHMEDILHPFHRGVQMAYQEQMANVKQRVSVGKPVQVNPVVFLSGLNQIARLEISVGAACVFRDSFNKCPDDLFIPLTHIGGFLNGQ